MATPDALRAALQCARPRCPCRRPGGTVHCPSHDDQRPSLRVTERDNTLLMHCFARCAQEAVIDALRARGLWPARDAQPGAPSSAPGSAAGAREMVYAIRDAAGRLVAEHVRIDRASGTKTFLWRRPDGRPGLGGLKTCELPLYRSETLAARAGERVVLCEGEKAADALAGLGVLALGTTTGASATPSRDVLSVLRGREVFLWPDADEPGRAHMSRIAQHLRAMGVTVRRIDWPAAPPGGDAGDFIAADGCVDALEALLDAAPLWAAEEDAAAAELVRLSNVAAETVHWLWPGRIALGKLTLLAGDPGLGKSLLALDLAARVSTGREMPDAARGDLAGPAGVVLLSAEDALADTIRPRLDAAGADCTRIVALQSVTERDADGQAVPRQATLADLEALRRAVRAVDAALVVIDPLVAYLPARVDAHRDQDVRRALAPLAALAAELGVAVLAIRHLNKNSSVTNATYRGGGSIAFTAAARSELLVAADPADPGRPVLAQVKCNLAAPPAALVYRIDTAPGGAARLRWLGESALSANALLAAHARDEDDQPALAEALDVLRAILADGPVPAGEVARLARQAGVSERTLKRAKHALSVRSGRAGFGSAGGWRWTLLEEADS